MKASRTSEMSDSEPSKRRRMDVARSKDQSRASMRSISPELLGMIIGCFCPHCRSNSPWPRWADEPDADQDRDMDIHSLYNLCLVSKLFRDVAQQVMYHMFDPKYPSACRTEETWKWRARLEPFVCTIASRPDLARTVKVVCLDSTSTSCLTYDTCSKAFKEGARARGVDGTELWKRKIQGYHNPDKSRRYPVQIIRAIDADAGLTPFHPAFFATELTTVLLALLPNLSHLKVFAWHIDFNLSRETFAELGITKLPLKTLDTNVTFECLGQLAPGLQTVVDRQPGLNRLWYDRPNVTSLVMQGMRIDGQDIQRGVAGCSSRLSHFSLVGAAITMEDTVKALDTEELRASLESIHIDRRTDAGYIRWAPQRTVPTLEPFVNLHTVFLTTHCIYPIHVPRCTPPSIVPSRDALKRVLPRGVVYLTVVDQDTTQRACLREGLLGLADAKPTLFKRLKRVVCNDPHVCDAHVQKEFEKCGVSCEYREVFAPGIFEDEKDLLMLRLLFNSSRPSPNRIGN